MVYVPGSGGAAAASVASGSTAAVTAAADVEELVESMMTRSLRYNHPFAREKTPGLFGNADGMQASDRAPKVRRTRIPTASEQASGRDRDTARARGSEGAKEEAEETRRTTTSIAVPRYTSWKSSGNLNR